jgi:hypothetical protein
VTHEYVIALGGTILGAEAGEEPPTAIAWAADHVLAVGPDDVVRAISRGDSTFIDIGACAVTAAPADVEVAERILREAVLAGRPFDAVKELERAGQLAPGERLEPGSPAELAFWSADPATLSPPEASSLRIVTIVRAGAFCDGDEYLGPFAPAGAPHARAPG